jgi:hypothetical protein
MTPNAYLDLLSELSITAIRISDGNRDRFLMNMKTNVFAPIFHDDLPPQLWL